MVLSPAYKRLIEENSTLNDGEKNYLLPGENTSEEGEAVCSIPAGSVAPRGEISQHGVREVYELYLKGQCHETYRFRIFSSNSPGPNDTPRKVFNFIKCSYSYS
jgi:hypothetical protein